MERKTEVLVVDLFGFNGEKGHAGKVAKELNEIFSRHPELNHLHATHAGLFPTKQENTTHLSREQAVKAHIILPFYPPSFIEKQNVGGWRVWQDFFKLVEGKPLIPLGELNSLKPGGSHTKSSARLAVEIRKAIREKFSSSR